MGSDSLVLIGLSLDIVGAFFLSVEAIKLENLRTLRQKVLGPVHHLTLSPTLVFVDATNDSMSSPGDSETRGALVAGLYVGLHYAAGAILLVSANWILDGRIQAIIYTGVSMAIGLPAHLGWLILPVALIIGLVSGLFLLGEAIHQLLIAITWAPLRVMHFIETKTPGGTVGLLGFLLLFVGFGLQILGTVSSGGGE